MAKTVIEFDTIRDLVKEEITQDGGKIEWECGDYLFARFPSVRAFNEGQYCGSYPNSKIIRIYRSGVTRSWVVDSTYWGKQPQNMSRHLFERVQNGDAEFWTGMYVPDPIQPKTGRAGEPEFKQSNYAFNERQEVRFILMRGLNRNECLAGARMRLAEAEKYPVGDWLRISFINAARQFNKAAKILVS